MSSTSRVGGDADWLIFRSDFPEPAAELAEGDVWRRDEVEAWINEHGDVVADMLKLAR